MTVKYNYFVVKNTEMRFHTRGYKKITAAANMRTLTL